MRGGLEGLSFAAFLFSTIPVSRALLLLLRSTTFLSTTSNQNELNRNSCRPIVARM